MMRDIRTCTPLDCFFLHCKKITTVVLTLMFAFHCFAMELMIEHLMRLETGICGCGCMSWPCRRAKWVILMRLPISYIEMKWNEHCSLCLSSSSLNSQSSIYGGWQSGSILQNRSYSCCRWYWPDSSNSSLKRTNVLLLSPYEILTYGIRKERDVGDRATWHTKGLSSLVIAHIHIIFYSRLCASTQYEPRKSILILVSADRYAQQQQQQQQFTYNIIIIYEYK